jgi:hypothetical protein
MSFPLEQSLALLKEQTGLNVANEVVSWFTYVTALVDPTELGAQARRVIAKTLKEGYGEVNDWSGDWRYLPLPFARYVNCDIPFIEFKVDLYLAANVFVVFDYYGEQVKFVKPLKTEVEKFRVPIILLSPIADGDVKKLSEFKLVERDPYYITLDVPGFGEVKLRDDLITSFRHFFKGKRLGQALTEAGLLPLDAGNLIDAMLEHALLSLNTSHEISADNSDVVGALEALGYKTKDIQKMVENAALAPSMSTEEKVKVVLKNMNI